MPAIPKLVLDTFCEVHDLLKPWAHAEFWDFATHDVIPNAVYLIGRHQFETNISRIIELASAGVCKIILSNPAEGSETLANQIQRYGIQDLVRDHRILLIGGGDMEPWHPCIQYDSFLPKILDYQENLQQIQHGQEIFQKKHKPYKFLFLNGRMRANRKYLLERLRLDGFLDQGLWTSLDQAPGPSRDIRLSHQGQDLMNTVRPVQYLLKQYEVPRYRSGIDATATGHFVKPDLFGSDWGEIYLYAPPYVDTYFSIVTETVFLYPYSFRTEKIWKPIAMGHPWICAANRGYYQDMKNLGFQTFSSIIDESFDAIEDNQKRIERIAEVIQDLCGSDLPAFLEAAEPVCKYNQQHLAAMRTRVREEFPERFFQFLKRHQWMT
jgi:hypothetical protein